MCENQDKEQSGINQLPERIAQWQGNEISNYTLNYKMSCFCETLVKEVTVTNGEVTKGVEKNQNDEVLNNVPSSEFSNYFVIESIFEFIKTESKSVDKFL